MISDKPSTESQAERERRAEEFYNSYEGGSDFEYRGNVIDFALAFAASEVRLTEAAAIARERMECARLVCDMCYDNGKPQRMGTKFIHTFGMGAGVECAAATIHERTKGSE